jgi:hypothetical protein
MDPYFYFTPISKTRDILPVPVVVNSNTFPLTLIALEKFMFGVNPNGTFTPSTVNVNVWFGLPPWNPEFKNTFVIETGAE